MTTSAVKKMVANQLSTQSCAMVIITQKAILCSVLVAN